MRRGREIVRLRPVSYSTINTHWLHEQVSDFAENWNANNLEITNSFESELLGSAGTIVSNRCWIEKGQRFLIVYADKLALVDVSRILKNTSYTHFLTRWG